MSADRGAGARTLRSNGETEARAYVEAEVPAPRAEPALDAERVEIVDPHHTPTLHLDKQQKGSGPRNDEQTRLREPGELSVELPDGLPLTASQLVIVPPELAAQWREEAKKAGVR
jgi:hypothetical protein